MTTSRQTSKASLIGVGVALAGLLAVLCGIPAVTLSPLFTRIGSDNFLFIHNLGWSADGYLYFYGVPGNGSDLMFWRRKVNGGKAESLQPPTGGICGGWPRILDVSGLADGRLGVVLECGYWSFIAYKGSSEPALETLLASAVSFDGATWDARTWQGFVAKNESGCAGFTRFRGPGDEPVPPPVDQVGLVERLPRSPALGGRSWPLDEPLFRVSPPNYCPDFGLAGWPRIRPGRQEVVFLAAPAAPPLDENLSVTPTPVTPSRWDEADSAVYSWETGASAREIAGGFSAPDDLVMSPDGAYVALVAKQNNTGKTVSVASGEFHDLAYSPKGDQLAAVSGGEIRILDLP